jgi:cell division protein ZipA
MDFSLHSFILVIGLMVIAFIIFDGIKKVREAKANQLDQDLDLLVGSDSLMESEDLPSFDELEIADDLVSEAFPASKKAPEPKLEIKAESEIKAEQNVEAPRVDESPILEAAVEPETTAKEDASEVFQVLDEPDEVLESFSVNDDVEVEVVEEPKVVNKPQKPSKAEMMAKALEAERQAREAQEEQEPRVNEPDVQLDEKEPVPVLMESIELGEQVDPNPPLQQELQLPEFVQQTLQDEPEDILTAEIEEPEIEALDLSEDCDVAEMVESKPVQKEKVGERLADRPAAQEIFVINVIKENAPLLKGSELNHIFKVCDMRFGEMDIFHRFEEANAQGKIQFSVVNSVKPGNFDMETIDSMETPGISLFMSLPGPNNPMEAFDAMAEVALVFSRNFNANLYDESHSDLTPQTLEHYRHRIREFSRKQGVKK